MPAKTIPLEQFFAGQDEALMLYEAVVQAVDSIGIAEISVTRSQIAFRRSGSQKATGGKGFAWVWMPGMYLRGSAAPLVLSVALPYIDPSPRWKEVVEPHPGRFMHHLELRDASEVDGEVLQWLQIAWLDAN